ncbi:unnamed protein product [Symbiodinium sp. CCMP2592]|nr:unnamed protein product [Symbiodinium sp. CCMP2592]
MAKSSSSASKKQKLDHLDAFRRGIPFVSCSALAAILNKVEQEGVPELHGRKNIKQAVLEKIAAMAGDCGSLLKQLTAVRIDGGDLHFHILNLPTMLQGLYRQEVSITCTCKTPQAWTAHGREFFMLMKLIPAINFPVLERHWFTLAVLRTELVQKVEAGIGQILRLILEDMFAQQLWNPVHGIVMKSTDALFVFHWTLHVFLQDGSAQKQTFANRQDIGSRVCMLCKNIFNVRREGDDDDEGKISSRHLTLSSCDLASDSALLQSWDRLAAKAGTESKARFAMLQQASGYLELWQLPGANKQGSLGKAVQAGWGPVMQPKFHWTLHLDGCYEKQGFLPACWVLEAARKYGSASSNTIRFDTSLLEEVTAEHLSVMGKEEGFHLRAHLLQPHACTAKLKKSLVQYNVLRQEDECMTSTMTRLKHGAIIKKGDMVLHGNEPGHECPYRCAKVHCCIELHNIALVMLAPATFLQQRWDMNMLKFREEAGDPQIYILAAYDLLCSVVYHKANDGTLTVLPPAYLRPRHA